MTKVNVDLLREVVQWAEREASKPVPERQWIQFNWISEPDVVADLARFEDFDDVEVEDCGTAYCVAGYIGQRFQPEYRHNEWSDTERMQVWDYAQQRLGLTDAEAGYLFLASNDAEDIRRIAERIAGGPL